MRYANVDNGVVVLVVDHNAANAPGYYPCPDWVGPDDLFDGTTFTRPTVPDPVPEMVTMFQARAALMQAGLFAAVDAHCKQAGGVTLQAWEYANHCYRNGALVTGLAPAFGLTENDLDNLFRAAASIEA